MNRSLSQKLNRGTVKLTDFINQIDFTNINKTFHPKIKEYTFFKLAIKLVKKQTSKDTRRLRKFHAFNQITRD